MEIKRGRVRVSSDKNIITMIIRSLRALNRTAFVYDMVSKGGVRGNDCYSSVSMVHQ